MKKIIKYIALLGIAIFFFFFVSNNFFFIGEFECVDFSELKLANAIIKKIEEFRKCYGRLPMSLNDVGIHYDESGPIYYDVNEDGSYSIWFGTTLGASCIYESKTKKWTPNPVG